MKKFLLAFVLMVWGIAAHAVDYVGILVTLVDGSTVTVSFEEKPVIKLQPDKLVVQTDVATTEFNRANVARFNYVTEDLSGINPSVDYYDYYNYCARHNRLLVRPVK